MIRKMLFMLLAVLFLTDGALAGPKKPKSAVRVAKVLTFPVAHPVKTLKGVFFGWLNGVGAVVDGVEYVAGEIFAGAVKVDALIDGAETKTNPVQKGTDNGVQHPDTSAPRPN